MFSSSEDITDSAWLAQKFSHFTLEDAKSAVLQVPKDIIFKPKYILLH